MAGRRLRGKYLFNFAQHDVHTAVHAFNAGFQNAERVGVLRVILLAVGCHWQNEERSLPYIFAHSWECESIKGGTVV